jgi:hypothetical protein
MFVAGGRGAHFVPHHASQRLIVLPSFFLPPQTALNLIKKMGVIQNKFRHIGSKGESRPINPAFDRPEHFNHAHD